jgi:hypothetical protein
MCLFCSGLNHPNVVRYLGIHKNNNGDMFVVTEFYELGSLSNVLAANKGKLSLQQLLMLYEEKKIRQPS